METAALILLMAGAVVCVALTVTLDLAVFSLSYAGFVFGILLVVFGLLLLYRCEMNRINSQP
jgi:hypothetical protein